jgi:hypothetical protein
MTTNVSDPTHHHLYINKIKFNNYMYVVYRFRKAIKNVAADRPYLIKL